MRDISKTVKASLGDQKEQDHTAKALPSSSTQIRIPTQRPVVQLLSKRQRTTEHVTKAWTTESMHTNDIQLPASAELAGDLILKRIQRFHLKKTSTVLQKMKELQESASKKVNQKVLSTPQQKPKNDQDDLWCDMIKPQEERHLQIDRF